MPLPIRFWNTCTSCVSSPWTVGSESYVTVAPLSSMTGFRLASTRSRTACMLIGAERRAAGADARIVQQVGDQLLHPRHAVHDVEEELVGVGVELVLVLALDQLHVAGDHPQRLLEIVRGDVGELLEFLVGARQLLGRVFQSVLGLLAVGDVRPVKADSLDLLHVMDRLLIPAARRPSTSRTLMRASPFRKASATDSQSASHGWAAPFCWRSGNSRSAAGLT